jgi:hypothetical protein
MNDLRFTPAQRTLVALALFFFALRFLWLGDTVFILDEPLMQLRIDDSFAHGVIPLFHSRGSSIPIPYGPGAIWFFMIPQLFTWRPEGVVFFQLCFQLLGYGLFARTVYRAYGAEAFAWALLALAVSPSLFFASRHPWDSALFVPLCGGILYCLQRLKEGGSPLPLHATMGLLAGYGINTHLMFGPIVLALGGTLLLWNLRTNSLRSWRSWIYLGAFAGCTLAVLLPYLVAATQIVLEEKPLEHARVGHRWGDGRNLWWIFLGTTTYESLFHGRIMLDEVRNYFYAFAGQPFAFFFKIDIFGWIGKLVAWIAAFSVLLRLIRLRFDDELLRIFATLSFFLLILVYQYLNIPMASHYFMPLWWFVFAGIAFAISALKSPGKMILLFFLGCTIAVNASYDMFALAYLHQNKGARNMEASVAISEQLRNMREICAWAKSKGRLDVSVVKDANLGDPTLDYLPRHLPECEGMRIQLIGDKSKADLFIHHPPDSATSAALVTDFLH